MSDESFISAGHVTLTKENLEEIDPKLEERIFSHPIPNMADLINPDIELPNYCLSTLDGNVAETPAGFYCKNKECKHREKGYGVTLSKYGRGFAICTVHGAPPELNRQSLNNL